MSPSPGSTAGLSVQAYLALAMVASTIYGANILLCVRCFRSYFKGTRADASTGYASRSHNISSSNGCNNAATRSRFPKGRRLAMCIYTPVMFALATEAILQEALMMTARRGTTIGLPFVIWGADGFLIWRCFVLYRGINPVRRAALCLFLTIYACLVLVVGTAQLLPLELPQSWHSLRVLSPPIALLICTGFLNVMVCGLITGRLLYAHCLLLKLLRMGTVSINTSADDSDNQARDPECLKPQSPYIRAVMLCIESSCMIYFVTFAGSISTLVTKDPSYVTASIILLPQICVLAPHLIIYRLSQGREHRIGQAEAALSAERMQSIEFARSSMISAGSVADCGPSQDRELDAPP